MNEHRHRHCDRRDRDRQGPSRQDIADAVKTVAGAKVPGTPRLAALRVIESLGLPFCVEERRVKEVSITSGDPTHGAKRSDDHLSRYVVELPIAKVSDDAVHGFFCPECDEGERARYRYRATHHIAGGESLWCLSCEEKLYGEEWG